MEEKPESKAERDDVEEPDDVMCFYCKKGHIVANCPMLKTCDVKLVTLVYKVGKELDMPVMSDETFSDLADFAPFVTDGVVSLPGGSVMVPIKILLDTVASQSFILEPSASSAFQ